jgi:hypothetical protein
VEKGTVALIDKLERDVDDAGFIFVGKRCEESAAEGRRLRRNTEGSVGEKLAKGWNEVPSGNVAFVDGEAVDGTTVS